MQQLQNRAERYRRAANKYADLAKHAEPYYLADMYRKVAVRYVFMAEDLLKWSERRRELDVHALADAFLDGQAGQSGQSRETKRLGNPQIGSAT